MSRFSLIRNDSLGMQAALRPGQASMSKPVDLRVIPGGRRRAPAVTRHQAKVFWADLVARRCGDRETAARMFGVTFQTACNWFDGYVCPSGDKVMIAVQLWPEEFATVEARAAA